MHNFSALLENQVSHSHSLLNRIRSLQHEDAENYGASKSVDTPDSQDKDINELLVPPVKTTTGPGNPFLAKLAIALGIAATITILSIYLKQPDQGPSLGIQYLTKDSSSSALDPSNVFTFKAFGYRVMLPESAPGYGICYTRSVVYPYHADVTLNLMVF